MPTTFLETLGTVVDSAACWSNTAGTASDSGSVDGIISISEEDAAPLSDSLAGNDVAEDEEEENDDEEWRGGAFEDSTGCGAKSDAAKSYSIPVVVAAARDVAAAFALGAGAVGGGGGRGTAAVTPPTPSALIELAAPP